MPATPASNTTTQAALLKELYTLPPVRVLNDKSWIHDNIAKEIAQLDFSGKYIRFPVTVQRELGGGSRADGGVLPVASAAVDVEAKALMQQHYYGLEWTELVEEVSKSQQGAFENVVSRKMKTVATDMAKGLNRQWYNPLIGAIESSLSTTSGASTVTVSTAAYPQYVRVGDTVDVVTLSTGVAVSNGTGRVVSAISSAGVITFGGTGDPGGNVSVTAGTHGLVITGNYGNEVVGLRGFADTARTLHNVNSSTYPSWDGNEFTVSGAVAGESAFEQLFDRVGERGRGDVDTFIGTRGIRRRLADEFASNRRYLNEMATSPKAGYRRIDLAVGGASAELVIDDDCPKGYAFAFKRDVLKLMQLTKPGFLEDGSGGARIELKDHTTAGQKVASYQAWYRYHVSMVCTDPALVGAIPDAADDTPSSVAA
jgi:hypothetical protein